MIVQDVMYKLLQPVENVNDKYNLIWSWCIKGKNFCNNFLQKKFSQTEGPKLQISWKKFLQIEPEMRISQKKFLWI